MELFPKLWSLIEIYLDLYKTILNNGGICGLETRGDAPRAGADAKSGIVYRSRDQVSYQQNHSVILSDSMY